MGNNKKTRMLINNDKMVTNNNMVLKMNGQDIRVSFNIKKFILGNRGHEDIGGRRTLDMILEDTKKYKGCCEH
jgi:hypothetical protein